MEPMISWINLTASGQKSNGKIGAYGYEKTGNAREKTGNAREVIQHETM
jgi:hypothetical protein